MWRYDGTAVGLFRARFGNHACRDAAGSRQTQHSRRPVGPAVTFLLSQNLTQRRDQKQPDGARGRGARRPGLVAVILRYCDDRERIRRAERTFRERSVSPWSMRQGADAVYAIGYTRPMAKTVPVREFRSRLSELLSDVADRRDHVLVTRNGKPAAALVPIDEYEALEETAEILSDSATLAAIEAGVTELARDETVTLAALRAELAERRATR